MAHSVSTHRRYYTDLKTPVDAAKAHTIIRKAMKKQKGEQKRKRFSPEEMVDIDHYFVSNIVTYKTISLTEARAFLVYLVKVLGNFKNIAKTLTNHHQWHMCYILANPAAFLVDTVDPGPGNSAMAHNGMFVLYT